MKKNSLMVSVSLAWFSAPNNYRPALRGIHEIFQKRHAGPRVRRGDGEHSSGAVRDPAQPLPYWQVWVDSAGQTSLRDLREAAHARVTADVSEIMTVGVGAVLIDEEVRVHRTLRCTRAMAAGVTESVEELLAVALGEPNDEQMRSMR